MIITWSKKNKKASSLSKSSSTDNSSFNNIDDVSFLSDSSFLGLMKVNESGICNSFSLSEDIEVSHCDFRAQMEKENFSYVLKHFADEIDDRTFVDKVVALYEKGNDFVIKELNKKLKGFIEEEKRIRVDNDIEMKDEGNNSLFKTITSKVQIRKHFDLISSGVFKCSTSEE